VSPVGTKRNLTAEGTAITNVSTKVGKKSKRGEKGGPKITGRGEQRSSMGKKNLILTADGPSRKKETDGLHNAHTKEGSLPKTQLTQPGGRHRTLQYGVNVGKNTVVGGEGQQDENVFFQ